MLKLTLKIALSGRSEKKNLLFNFKHLTALYNYFHCLPPIPHFFVMQIFQTELVFKIRKYNCKPQTLSKALPGALQILVIGKYSNIG